LNTLIQNTLLHAFVKTAAPPCPGQSREAEILSFPQELSMKTPAFNLSEIFSGDRELHGCLRPVTCQNMMGFQPDDHQQAKQADALHCGFERYLCKTGLNFSNVFKEIIFF